MAADAWRLARSWSRRTTLAVESCSACPTSSALRPFVLQQPGEGLHAHDLLHGGDEAVGAVLLGDHGGLAADDDGHVDLVVGHLLAGALHAVGGGELDVDIEAVGHVLQLVVQLGRPAHDGHLVGGAAASEHVGRSTAAMDAASTTATMIQNERRRMVSRSSRPATRRMFCHVLMPAPRSARRGAGPRRWRPGTAPTGSVPRRRSRAPRRGRARRRARGRGRRRPRGAGGCRTRRW